MTDRLAAVAADRVLKPTGRCCQQAVAELGFGLNRLSSIARAADQPMALVVGYDAATAFFLLTTEGRDGKHSKRRSAYVKPMRLTASASK